MRRNAQRAICVGVVCALVMAASAHDARAQPIEDAPAPAPHPPPAIAADPSPFTGRLYGFMESRVSAIGAEPNGDTRPDGSPSRYPTSLDLKLPSFHVMAQGSFYSRFRYYFNLVALPDAEDPTRDTPIALRNAWLEASILGDYLNLRVGKMYRRFGLYNEILDTVPSFIGVETPVYIHGYRPMLTRTTNAMVHGKTTFGPSTVAYAATIGKDEISRNDSVWSPGLDLNYDYDSTFLVGTSFFTTAGTVTPDVDPGAGAPGGGVAPWLAQDRYQVYGGYGRLTVGSFLLHVEGWISPHEAERDPAKVLGLARSAQNFSAQNRARMGVLDPNGGLDQVVVGARYTYTALDVRAAYTFDLGSEDAPLEITPYVDFEYLRNLESISDVKYGGDDAFGESSRGIAMHHRVGAVFKPVPPVALKIEATYARYAYGDGFAGDPELWTSLSYQWELFHK